MKGYGDPLFRNVSTPFRPDPPRIPREYNPTGSYRRSFIVPASWKDKEVFLRMEKTASASFVWVNGKEVGYNEGGQEPAEYNITRYIKPGENSMAVVVYKYSDGYYLEDQDYWRLAGIFDDVWLFAAPKVRIFRLVCCYRSLIRIIPMQSSTSRLMLKIIRVRMKTTFQSGLYCMILKAGL